MDRSGPNVAFTSPDLPGKYSRPESQSDGNDGDDMGKAHMPKEYHRTDPGSFLVAGCGEFGTDDLFWAKSATVLVALGLLDFLLPY